MPTQRDALLAHLLKAYNVSLPDMQAGTIERRLEDPELPEPVKELLSIRLQTSGTTSASTRLFCAPHPATVDCAARCSSEAPAAPIVGQAGLCSCRT